MAVTTDVTDRGDNLELIIGDAYLNADGTAIIFTESTDGEWPNLSDFGDAAIDGVVKLKINTLTVTGAIVLGGGDGVQQSVRFDITTAQMTTTNFPDKSYRYQVYVQNADASRKKTLVTGLATIRRF
jgi:hypothetical protein